MALIGLMALMVTIRLIGLKRPTPAGLTGLGVMGLIGLIRFTWPRRLIWRTGPMRLIGRIKPIGPYELEGLIALRGLIGHTGLRRLA
eukprot:8915879-Pyramimonas_sp.AAC.1